MRFFLAFAVSASTLVAANQLSIDHVTICGSHLQAMSNAFETATSVKPEYGGRHANHATEMALVSFPDGAYLELMAIQPDAEPQAVADHVWSKFLRANAGPCAFAIRVPDVAAEVTQLKRAGIDVKAPVRSGRSRPDGVRLEWQTSDVGHALRGTFFPFLIHDLTTRQNRVYPSGKPTTTSLSGISMIVIAVDNLSDAISRYSRAFNLPRPVGQHDAWSKADLAWFEGTPIVLAQATSKESWVALRVQKYGEGPCAVVLGARGGISGAEVSNWFGHKVTWPDSARLGWHLGIE